MTDHLGDIWLVLNQAVDYETDGGTISVTVTVTDSDGLTGMAEVDVAVVNVNEPPTIGFDGDSETPDGHPAVSTVDEHIDGDFTPVPVGLVTVSDPEQALTADDITVGDDRFSLMTDAFGGIWLMLNEGLDADVEGGGSVSVMLSVADASGLTAETEAVITVNNINESPTISVQTGVVPAADGGAGASGAINENIADGFPAYEIIVSDPEDDLTAANVAIDDDRFIVKTDSEGGLWAFLNEAVNFEELDDDDDESVTHPHHCHSDRFGRCIRDADRDCHHQ